MTEARHAEIVEELEHRFSVATSENEVKANVVSLVNPTTGHLLTSQVLMMNTLLQVAWVRFRH
ncbi:MAG: hypothetical protein ACLTZB_07610 [Streptococcus salivarius]